MQENKGKFYAHTTDCGEWEPLEEHLMSTATAASEAAVSAFSDIAYDAGLWHDAGKATREFQAYIRGGGGRVEHSVCGAQQVAKLPFCGDAFSRAALEYVISGHHAGLPDYGKINPALRGTDSHRQGAPKLRRVEKIYLN